MPRPTKFDIGEVYSAPMKNMLVYPTPKWVYVAGGGQNFGPMATHNFVALEANGRTVTQAAQSLENGTDYAKSGKTFTEIDGPLHCMALLGKVGRKNDWTTVCATTREDLGGIVTTRYGISMEDFTAATNDPEKYCAENETCLDFRSIDSDKFAIPVMNNQDDAKFRKTWPTGASTTSRFPFR
jgi:hypothetical protein